MTRSEYMTRLEANIEEYVMRKIQTPKMGKEFLWDDICSLRNDSKKEEILKEWKYGHSFKLAEESHLNGNIPFGKNLSWEQSFVLGFLLYEFH